MEISSPIGALLSQKGKTVWSVSPETMVFDAIQMMSDKNVGALPVMRGDEVLGMFSERDYTRKIVLKGRSSRETSVGDIMSSSPLIVTGDDSVDRCMRLMTQNRVRHLPVVENGRLVGIVSIGDLVNWIISAQNAAIDQLERYISGSYPG
jgi:CBS domain-containing protein